VINVVNAWEQLMQTGESAGIEHRIRLRDGSYRWFLTKILPLCDEHQHVTRWLGSSTDIHDQKTAQDQLLHINELLEERAAQRTRSLVEHQEQLRAMASDLTLTEQRERRRLAGELHDYLAQLLVACKMKARLLVPTIQTPRGQSLVAEVNDLLEQSLKYTRTLIAELSPTILYEVGLPAAVRWLGEQMERHGLTVEVQQDDNIAPLPDDQAVLVFEAIRELLVNTAKHAMVHKASVRLERMATNRMKITVADEGVGFDVASMAGPLSVGKHGLFTIHERLEVLGGHFEIDSAPGLGTRAILTVPMEAAESRPEGAVEAPTPIMPQPTPALSRPTHRRITRVLLADDHNMVREGLRNLIENEPRLRVVGEAANGEEVIKQARNLRPDVIVMDINMPKINGIEATRRIREELPCIAVVALSMHEDKSMIAAMKEAGAVTYIPKGGASEELSRAIREAHISAVSTVDVPACIAEDTIE
jgi:signal transduction histidine kinase/ActR/RegA family two-component response regulator